MGDSPANLQFDLSVARPGGLIQDKTKDRTLPIPGSDNMEDCGQNLKVVA